MEHDVFVLTCLPQHRTELLRVVDIRFPFGKDVGNLNHLVVIKGREGHRLKSGNFSTAFLKELVIALIVAPSFGFLA